MHQNEQHTTSLVLRCITNQYTSSVRHLHNHNQMQLSASEAKTHFGFINKLSNGILSHGYKRQTVSVKNIKD